MVPPLLPDLPSLERFLRERGIEDQTLGERGTDTLFRPPVVPVSHEDLRRLTGDGAELELTRTIARGGMGTVHLARQRSLRRDVAVKTARAGEGATAGEAAALIVEGRVTGALEHPNIVPVHMLGVNEEDEVLLVMKRIEGQPWSSLLAARSTIVDDVEQHLRILMAVCDGVSLAHGRGIIHRDIKPQNVMVGPFREVYLLDWGLAGAYSDHAPEGVPRVGATQDIAGTPAFMAPEMAQPGAAVDPRTDVYLLGGALHVILTGRPPHDTAGGLRALRDAHGAPSVTLPPHVPEEIAAVCVRALSTDPAARFPSAEAFRAALEVFLQHDGARALCEQAARRLVQLEDEAVVDPAQVQRAFTEARFGFEQALRAWPGSVVARDGLDRALAAMARHELAAGRVDSAALLLAEQAQQSPELLARVERLRERRAREAEDLVALRDLARERDASVSTRARIAVLLTLGAMWFIAQLIAGELRRRGVFDVGPAGLAIVQAACIVAFTGFLIVRRRELGANTASRSLVFAMYASMVGCLAVDLIALVADLDLAALVALYHVVICVAVSASSSDIPGFWRTLGILALGLFAPLAPAWASELNGSVVFAAIVSMSWALWKTRAGSQAQGQLIASSKVPNGTSSSSTDDR